MKHTPAPLGLQQFGDEVMVVGKHSDRPIVLQAARLGRQGKCLRIRDGGIMRPITLADEAHPDIARWFACVGALEGIADPAAFVKRAKAIERTMNDIAFGTQGHAEESDARVIDIITDKARAALALPGGES